MPSGGSTRAARCTHSTTVNPTPVRGMHGTSPHIDCLIAISTAAQGIPVVLFIGVLCFSGRCLHGCFFAVINRVGWNRRLDINILFLTYAVILVTIATTAGELSSSCNTWLLPCGHIGHPPVDSRSFLCDYRSLSPLPVDYDLHAKRWQISV